MRMLGSIRPDRPKKHSHQVHAPRLSPLSRHPRHGDAYAQGKRDCSPYKLHPISRAYRASTDKSGHLLRPVNPYLLRQDVHSHDARGGYSARRLTRKYETTCLYRRCR